jgi:hypothetical protein
LFNPSGVEVTFNDDACETIASNLSYFTGSVGGTYVIHAGCYSDTACGGDPVAIRAELAN